jgi:tRNA (guanine-N7-)-methyltransferase
LGKSKKENTEIHNNTGKYKIEYSFDDQPESTSYMPSKFKSEKCVNILDVGCGYGGLLFNMSTSLGPEDLALGMEIRDKVSNFVGDKIKSLRVNSDHNQYSNIGILRTNTMKLLLNYFYKEQLDKIFFCFPDPHFKKYNHRKRIIK